MTIQNVYYLPGREPRSRGDLPACVERHHWEVIQKRGWNRCYRPVVRCAKCKGMMERSGKHRLLCSGRAGM